MSVSIDPVRDLVLVRMVPLPEQTGLIQRVNTLRHEYTRDARVLEIGPQVHDVKAGDLVAIPSLVGQKVGSGDDRLLPESSILYVKEEAAA